MGSTYSVTEAQAKLPELLREAEDHLVAVQRRNETVAYVISRARMEAIAETLELLATPRAMAAIARDQAGKGKYHALAALDDEG